MVIWAVFGVFNNLLEFWILVIFKVILLVLLVLIWLFIILFGFCVVKIKWIFNEWLICVIEVSLFKNFGIFVFNFVNLLEIKIKWGNGLVG